MRKAGNSHFLVKFSCKLVLALLPLLVAPAWAFEFLEHPVDSDTYGPTYVTDLDEDNDPDIVTSDGWYENDGQANFTKHLINTVLGSPESAADLDSDGDLDLIGGGSSLVWYENDGDQNFTERLISTGDVGCRFQDNECVVGVDLDGDGDTDVLSGASSAGKIAWHENDGSQNFTERVIATGITAYAIQSVLAIDLDNDNDMDVISSAGSWYENDGMENFTEHALPGTDGNETSAADLDGDNDIDLVVVRDEGYLDPSFTAVAWFENDGNQVFTEHVLGGEDRAYSLHLVDFESDGDTDLVVGWLSNPGMISWFENIGSGAFVRHDAEHYESGSDFPVSAADFDGDGDTDLLSTSSGMSWHENVLGSCSVTLGVDRCKLKPRFRKTGSGTDKVTASCKVLDTYVAVAGIDPSVEQMLFTLDDAGGVCFTAAIDPADCVEKKGSFKCKPPKGTVPYVKVKIKPDRRNPGSYKLKFKAKEADLQCLNYAETPWTMGLTIGDDCGQVDCPSTGQRIECVKPSAAVVQAGDYHTCVLFDNGDVRCWGDPDGGQLGYGNLEKIGNNETPASVGYVDVGGVVAQLASDYPHNCALLDTGTVRCWGRNHRGQLGYGHTNNIGDNEVPASAGDVDVGGTVVQVTVGYDFTCALLDNGAVRCWGDNRYGKLGYGHTNNIGDDETPASAGDVDVGGVVVELFPGDSHTCALLEAGTVRCWGRNRDGQLGYGHTNNIGDDEVPASAGDVNVGGTVVQIVGGYDYTCALLDDGAVRCWGDSRFGQLGYGNTVTIGDDESPASAGDVDIGGKVVQLSATDWHTCALLDTGSVRCWGDGSDGKLGYGNEENIGDDETPASAGAVDVGGTVIQASAAIDHTCALLDNGAIRCWGRGKHGVLGYGNIDSIGDDETPASAGDVLFK
jgi:alpha-tubulin suppressor-like RCC1 family protein